MIGGEKIALNDVFAVYNPCQTSEVISWFPNAQPEHLEAAIEAAMLAFETWRFSEPLQRAQILLQTAALARRQRFRLNAIMSLENGKNWAEADGEIAEFIDHCEYFARECLRWAEGKPLEPLAGEHVYLHYEPIGVVAAISPWNFPSAIPYGLAFGAIVTGNTVVLKPASEAPTSAYVLLELLQQAGLPAGVINFFLTGSDAVLGDPLVDHPNIAMVAFTGSKEIGLRIYQRASVVHRGQNSLKRVIAEMGGKDATVVCADAHLEQAALGIVQAAFGYSGQKCSACSRVIADESIYEALLAQVVALTEQLTLGPAEDNYPVGALIHNESGERILGYIERAKQDSTLVCGGQRADIDHGFYIQPTIFRDVSPDSKLFQHEIFGPVLSFTPADGYEHAIELANYSEYALTGALYSQDPEILAYARQHFEVGNLYLNRKCTGAMSGTHAFGGFQMSGTCAKVGGPDYLFFFVRSKTIAQRFG